MHIIFMIKLYKLCNVHCAKGMQAEACSYKRSCGVSMPTCIFVAYMYMYIRTTYMLM